MERGILGVDLLLVDGDWVRELVLDLSLRRISLSRFSMLLFKDSYRFSATMLDSLLFETRHPTLFKIPIIRTLSSSTDLSRVNDPANSSPTF